MWVIYSFQNKFLTEGMCVVISMGNSTVSRGIWDKYRKWYFKIHQNITSRHDVWYLGSFEISQAGIYPKYPEETLLFLFILQGKEISHFIYHTNTYFYLVTCSWLAFQQHVTGCNFYM